MLAKLKCIEGNLCEDPGYCPQNLSNINGGQIRYLLTTIQCKSVRQQ